MLMTSPDPKSDSLSSKDGVKRFVKSYPRNYGQNWDNDGLDGLAKDTTLPEYASLHKTMF
ncbi:hypothetical protein MAR_003116 [Mya arenaria]|uniref:Uncharacterized protein n=3 Tax=Mya arenaria TaxID=6604 RepID=A0ABY7G539_MYAAR|nr:hypothetical protein MAR_003116 [Mya arenaria]